MKKRKGFFNKRPIRQKIFIVLSAVWLFFLFKLLHIDSIFFSSESLYFVEPQLSTSDIVRNQYKDTDNRLFNCSQIYEQDPVEIGKSLEIRRKSIIDLQDEDVAAMTRDCQAYHKIRQYSLKPVSLQERQFPLAYSLVVHKDAIHVERLLHSIYSTTNIYCIHYDQKSSITFIAAMDNLARCFPNVFIASKLERVTYAHVSRLHADLNCLSDLMKTSVPWQYVINLCGQDLPLRSNFELVSELKKLNGANMLESVRPSNLKKERYTFHHEVKKDFDDMPSKTSITKDAPPYGIEMFVGSAYFVLSRLFIEYVLQTPVAKDFLAWCQDTYSPDEHFWATLVRVPGVPGEIPQSNADVTDLQSKTRLVKWNYLEDYLYPPCTGSHQRSVCIYGAAELRWLLQYGHWFANKFDAKVDPILIKCLIEKLEEKQREWNNMSSDTVFMYPNMTQSTI